MTKQGHQDTGSDVPGDITFDQALSEAGMEPLSRAVPPGPDQAEEKKLAPDEVELADGRVARIKSQKGMALLTQGKMLTRFGYTATELGPEVYGYIKAVLSIDTLDGEPFKTPEKAGQIDFWLNQFDARDLVALTMKYVELNLPESLGGTFRR